MTVSIPENEQRVSQPGEQIVRLLLPITRVRRSELFTALLLTLDVFVVLMAYACIKPVREAFILVLSHGPQDKIYLGAVVGLTTAVAVPLYARVATRPPRNRLIIGVTLFFASHLLLFWLWARSFGPSPALAVAFYVWISVFNMMIVAQFWAFANDVYSEEAGKRLFPLLGVGASLGAVCGSWLARGLLDHIGTTGMLLLAAAVLAASTPIVQIVHLRETRVATDGGVRRSLAPVAKRGEAFRMVIRDRYLTLIAVFAVLFTVIKTDGEFVLAKLVKQAAEHTVGHAALAGYIGSVYARYNLYVDVGSLVLELFVVSRVVRRLGVGVAFLMLPFVALAGNMTLAVFPLLLVALPCRVAENATDYSMNNTALNMLWLPTSRRAKYIAKEAVDTFFVRMGDVTSAALVFVAASIFAVPVRGFVLANLVFVVLSIVVARKILTRRNALLAKHAAEAGAEASDPEEEQARPHPHPHVRHH